MPLLLRTQNNLSSWLVGERWIFSILEAVNGSKSEKILPLSYWKESGMIRSATLWMEGWVFDGAGGMKLSRVGIQGDSHIAVWCPLPIFMHNLLLRSGLDFRMPFHSQEQFWDGITCMKGTPLRYLDFNKDTQGLSSSAASDHPSLEIKAWLVSNVLRRPRPP